MQGIYPILQGPYYKKVKASHFIYLKAIQSHILDMRSGTIHSYQLAQLRINAKKRQLLNELERKIPELSN